MMLLRHTVLALAAAAIWAAAIPATPATSRALAVQHKVLASGPGGWIGCCPE